jgi:hypothetical protein
MIHKAGKDMSDLRGEIVESRPDGAGHPLLLILIGRIYFLQRGEQLQPLTTRHEAAVRAFLTAASCGREVIHDD